jgi:hypothetical protein
MQMEFVDIDGVVHDSVTITDPRGPQLDTDPPVITAIEVVATSGGGTVVWTTDEPATSQVAYGATTALGSLSPLGATRTTDHAVAISGLQELSTYFYQPISSDALGNTATGAISSFTTPQEGVTHLLLTADAHIDSATPDANLGSNPSLAFAKNDSREIRSLLRFIGLPAPGTPVGLAELGMFVSNDAMEPEDVWNLERSIVVDGWDEDSITWNNQPASGSPLDGSSFSDPIPGTWAYPNVTQSVQAAIAAGATELTILLSAEKIAGDGGLDEVSFRSGEHSDPALHPSLTLWSTAPPPNGAPTVGAVNVSGDQDSAIAWAPAVADPDGDAVTGVIVDPPTNGAAVVAADCSSGTYTPTAGFFGTGSFTYRASDGSLSSNNGAVSVTVEEVIAPNTAPTAGKVKVNGKRDRVTSWRPKASDAEGDALTCEIVGLPQYGVATMAPDCSSGTYEPDLGWTGSDSFTYRASDGSLLSGEGIVSVRIRR